MSEQVKRKNRTLYGRDTFNFKKSPVFGIAVIILFTLGIVLLPGEKLGGIMLGGNGTAAQNLGNAIFRAAGFALLLLLAIDIGYDIFSFKGRALGLILTLPFIIVIIDNAPLAGLANGDVVISASAANYFYFALYVLFVGLFEEIAFRGIIFPLLLGKFKNNKLGIFAAVAVSSVLFGAIHLINLLSSDPASVIMQVGYSCLIGAMCAMAMLMCRNIFVCALLHAAFDFCGLIADSLGNGQVWNALNITLTAVVGVLAVLYGVYLMLRRVKPSEVAKIYSDGIITTSEESDIKTKEKENA